jgi:hypothetical protein
MADSVHYILSTFRETMLTAIAKLEFELRDTVKCRPEPIKQKYPPMGHWLNEDCNSEISDIRDNEVDHLTKTLELVMQRLDALENTQKSCTTSVCKEDVHELLQFQPVKNTKNILVSSVKSTPALAAAVAAASANPPVFTLDSTQTDESFTIDTKKEVVEVVEAVEAVEDEVEEAVEDEVEEAVEEEVEEAVEEEVEEEVVDEETVVEEEEEVEEESPDLQPIKIKGKQYYKDDENNIYAETEDGYEQIGIYNPKTKDIEVQEEVEEEEEGVEVEEFEFKGKTYQRDTENNVYLDGEIIGTWNGKKIVPT